MACNCSKRPMMRRSFGLRTQERFADQIARDLEGGASSSWWRNRLDTLTQNGANGATGGPDMQIMRFDEKLIPSNNGGGALTPSAVDVYGRTPTGLASRQDNLEAALRALSEGNAAAHMRMQAQIQSNAAATARVQKKIMDQLERMDARIAGRVDKLAGFDARVRDRLLLDAGPERAYGADRDANITAAYGPSKDNYTGGIVVTDQPATLLDNAIAGTTANADFQGNGGRLQGTQLCTVWATIGGPGTLLTDAANVTVTMTINEVPVVGMTAVPLQTFAQDFVGRSQRLALRGVRLPAGVTPRFRLDVINALSGAGDPNTITFSVDSAQTCARPYAQ